MKWLVLLLLLSGCAAPGLRTTGIGAPATAPAG
ncbi:MAG: hypothetical protein RIR43_478, partial [Pseudomonadota bacterium]